MLLAAYQWEVDGEQGDEDEEEEGELQGGLDFLAGSAPVGER